MNPHQKTRLQLERYATLDGTEVGEVCELLLDIARNPDYISDEFAEAVKREIEKRLAWFVENTEIVKEKETTTRTVERLEWLDR